jgi:glycosyltransferase involved in cell wall biosynthesis
MPKTASMADESYALPQQPRRSVTFITQFYPYENSDESNLFSDAASGLHKDGYDVTVLCGARPYRGRATAKQVGTVRTVRVPALSNAVGGVRKALEYAYFLICALAFVSVKRRTDVLLVVTCPPLLPVVGALWRRLNCGKLVIWEMDVYPDTAIAVGKIGARATYTRVLSAVAAWAYRSADRVIVIGECMKARLVSKGVPGQTISVVENWANENNVSPRRDISQDSLTVLYSGNLGWVHDMDTIAGGMCRLRNEPRLLFRFVGSGACRPRLEQLCAAKNITNVEFLADVPVEAFAASLSSGDVGLVTQREETLGCVVPSKLYSVLGAGRPVLFIGPAASASARLILRFECGWHIHPGDVEGLVERLLWLRTHPSEVAAAGDRARRIFLQDYTSAAGVSRFCRAFDSEVSR